MGVDIYDFYFTEALVRIKFHFVRFLGPQTVTKQHRSGGHSRENLRHHVPPVGGVANFYGRKNTLDSMLRFDRPPPTMDDLFLFLELAQGTFYDGTIVLEELVSWLCLNPGLLHHKVAFRCQTATCEASYRADDVTK